MEFYFALSNQALWAIIYCSWNNKLKKKDFLKIYQKCGIGNSLAETNLDVDVDVDKNAISDTQIIYFQRKYYQWC